MLETLPDFFASALSLAASELGGSPAARTSALSLVAVVRDLLEEAASPAHADAPHLQPVLRVLVGLALACVSRLASHPGGRGLKEVAAHGAGCAPALCAAAFWLLRGYPASYAVEPAAADRPIPPREALAVPASRPQLWTRSLDCGPFRALVQGTALQPTHHRSQRRGNTHACDARASPFCAPLPYGPRARSTCGGRPQYRRSQRPPAPSRSQGTAHHERWGLGAKVLARRTNRHGDSPGRPWGLKLSPSLTRCPRIARSRSPEAIAASPLAPLGLTLSLRRSQAF